MYICTRLLFKNNKEEKIDLNNLNKFLEENIFKIEKLLGKFIKNISLIIEDCEKKTTYFGLKKKIYEDKIDKKYLENLLTDAKDLFKENYPDEKIMHIIINNYLINGKKYFYLQDNLECEQFNLEIQFKSISNETTYNLNKLLQNYQINIIKFLDGNYVKNSFNKEIEISKMAFDILNGFNVNEVMVVQKSTKKLGFFEKFFQLFS